MLVAFLIILIMYIDDSDAEMSADAKYAYTMFSKPFCARTKPPSTRINDAISAIIARVLILFIKVANMVLATKMDMNTFPMDAIARMFKLTTDAPSRVIISEPRKFKLIAIQQEVTILASISFL